MSTRPSAAESLGHRPALDGLRAVAVSLVVGIHVGLIPGGYIGVDVFLALSGFLITALLLEERDRTGSISLRRFAARRVRRLLPALLLLLVVFTVLMVTVRPFHPVWPVGWLDVTTLGFAGNWVTTLDPLRGRVLGPLSPTWTLAQEGQFYLLWPPALWFLLRRNVRPRALALVLGVMIVALLALVPVVHRLDPVYNTYTNPLGRSAELLCGALVAILWRERRLPRAAVHPAAAWAAAAGLLAILLEGPAAQPRWYLAAAVLGTLLIVGLLGSSEERDHRATRRGAARAYARVADLPRVALELRPLAYVGKISYGIYLFHLPLFYLAERYVGLGSPLVSWVVVLGAATCAAAISWTLIESPVVRRGRSRRQIRLPSASGPPARRRRMAGRRPPSAAPALPVVSRH